MSLFTFSLIELISEAFVFDCRNGLNELKNDFDEIGSMSHILFPSTKKQK